jgi:hypothetical protein
MFCALALKKPLVQVFGNFENSWVEDSKITKKPIVHRLLKQSH